MPGLHIPTQPHNVCSIKIIPADLFVIGWGVGVLTGERVDGTLGSAVVVGVGALTSHTPVKNSEVLKQPAW